jgi:MFS family permease
MLAEVSNCALICIGRQLTVVALAGAGVGFLVMIIPPYQAELCHPDIRGRVTALQQFMLGVGALVAAWVSYGAYTGFPATSTKQWRVSLGIQIIPAGILAMLILFFPESPRYEHQVLPCKMPLTLSQMAYRPW